MHSKRWLRNIQVIVTLGLIVWLSWQANWTDLGHILGHAQWNWIFLGTLFVLVSHWINIFRWKLFIPPSGVSFVLLLRYYGAGIFSNNFLPTGIGGDGVRAVLLSRQASLSSSLLSVGSDRILGLVGLLSFVVPGFVFGLPPGITAYFAKFFSSLPYSLTIGLILIGLILGLITSWWTRFLWFTPLSQSLKQFSTDIQPHSFILGYSFALLSALCLVFTHMCILIAFDQGSLPAAAIWLVVMGSLSMLIPISINGLGVMESVYVLVLVNYGIQTAAALSVALVIRTLIIGFGLLGGLLALHLGIRGNQVPPQEQMRDIHKP
ncbi:lysylphosphatidylglycerol synthase transmembrane domain-containing protein [Candidatus Chloroploca asiatica]|uniref:TIGR00374 family protein n=1 Tax=Candidatus Chloroploca asiatica TaxID=1506545 RepID=A0A2H3KJI8_9CHLR|nr:lysylphosphatidylglycerol synthase transmembrane domain-containing protein [Candidatus Chloroploca asiatica]PDV98094.1 hypothetical protein A9Q02_03165 [Candidatus Chloroploca asiatica]